MDFINIFKNALIQKILFGKCVYLNFIRLKAHDEINGFNLK